MKLRISSSPDISLRWLVTLAALFVVAAITQIVVAKTPDRADPSSQVRAAVSSDGVRLAYEVRGKGPLLMLLHGASQDRSIWKEYVTPLSSDFTVVSLDLRGHGQSDKPEQEQQYSSEAWAADVQVIADDLGARKFSIWGFSLGGTIGLQIAAQSDRLERAVIAGSQLGQVFTEEMIRRSVTRLGELAELQREGKIDEATLTPAEKAIVSRGDIKAQQAWLSAAPHWAAIRADQLRCPTFLYAGERDPAASRLRSDADEMNKASVFWRVLPQLDHREAITRKEAVLPIVTAFLKTGRISE